MSDSFQYITRPSSGGLTIMTQPRYRGTRSTAEVVAHIATATGKPPADIEAILRAYSEYVIDQTIGTWKVEPVFDLIGFQCGSGGSVPIGGTEDWDFDSMDVALRGYWGEAGRQRAEAAFTAEKVGEQNRITPVFVEVYDSDTKTPNHYVAGRGLTLIMGNRNAKFDPAAGGFLRFQKPDGTFIAAASFPYIKGNTIVAIVPIGTTGPLELQISMEINGQQRLGVYPFELT